MQEYSVLAEVQVMVVHQFQGTSYALALIQRYKVKTIGQLVQIMGSGRKEWVDMISIEKGVGICSTSASGRSKRFLINRDTKWRI
jgi:hypothetical protein